jgi:hypothetical protein
MEGKMNEVERNKRLFLLLDKLVGLKDQESIELIETWIENDTPAMKKSFSIVKDSGNFSFFEINNKFITPEDRKDSPHHYSNRLD